jgi:hypothetical protein
LAKNELKFIDRIGLGGLSDRLNLCGNFGNLIKK